MMAYKKTGVLDKSEDKNMKDLLKENIKIIDEGGELSVPLAQIPNIKQRYIRKEYKKLYNKEYHKTHPTNAEKHNISAGKYYNKKRDEINRKQREKRASQKQKKNENEKPKTNNAVGL